MVAQTSQMLKSVPVDVTEASTGTEDYTGLGFDPVAGSSVLFTMINGSTATGETDIAFNGIGAAVSSTNNFSATGMSEDVSDPTDTFHAINNNRCIRLLSATGSSDGSASFSVGSQMDSGLVGRWLSPIHL